jgi:4'-phosphopantetheinyl transferase
MQQLLNLTHLKIYFDTVPNSMLDYECILQSFHLPLQVHIQMYKSKIDRMERITGYNLLNSMIKDFGLSSQFTLNHLMRSHQNKPYLSNDFRFSISHSNHRVVCIASISEEVGIDIESLSMDVSLIQKADYLSIAELDIVEQSIMPTHKFIEYWTRKEAVAKASGLGISTPFLSLNIIDDSIEFQDKFYKLTTLKFPEFIISYACSNMKQTSNSND